MRENRCAWQGVLSLLALIALSFGNSFEALWAQMTIGTRAWSLCNTVAACTQWAMPTMVVLLGSVFLSSNRQVKLGYLWKRYVLPAAAGCALWWTLSAVVWMRENYPQELDLITFRECMAEVLEAPAHIGFCQMIVSFFMLYPLLCAVAHDRRLTAYGIMLIFAMSLVEPILRAIPYLSAAALFADQLNWGYYRAWAFYLLCGAWIAGAEHDWRASLLMYSLGIVSSGAMVALTSVTTAFQPGYANEYMGYASPLTGIQTVSICLFVRNAFGDVHAPRLTHMTKNMWHCAPVLFVVSPFTERLIEYFPLSDLGYALCSAALNAAAAFCAVLALGALPGFRGLVGDYLYKGDKAV